MESELAYLVIREGAKWTDVFRLVEGRTVTIGRAPTNQIVIKDERCSRYHAEVFSTKGEWMLRDLDSRNGTDVNGKRIRGDHALSPGETLQIAHAQLAFVYDLSNAFPDTGAPESDKALIEDETVEGKSQDDASVLELHEPTTITHRRGQTRFLKPQVEEEEEAESNIPKVGRAAAKLCRLAFELANQTDVISVAKLALDGLFEGTTVDAGAGLARVYLYSAIIYTTIADMRSPLASLPRKSCVESPPGSRRSVPIRRRSDRGPADLPGHLRRGMHGRSCGC